jgi:hypothetical protein
LQLQVSAAEPKAELVNRFDSGREGYLARLLDSTGQVQLTFPDGRTQLLPYRTHLQPVVADGKVYFFTSQYNFLTGVVVYDSAKGWGESSRLPEDLHSNGNWEIGQPSFSPDGTMVAYYVKEKANVEMRFALIDLTGPTAKEVVQPQLENCRYFAENLAAVKLKGKWGYLDVTGKMVIPAQFEEAWEFSEGLAPVQQGEKWGFINRAGKMVIKPQFDRVRNFSDGLALVKPTEEKNKYGFIDRTGKTVIPPQAGITEDGFHEGLARIRLENKVGFMDRAGKIVIFPQFESAGDFHEGMARVYVGNKVGFIDQTGKIVIPVQFGPHTQEFADGVAWVWKTGPKAGWPSSTRRAT